MNHSYKCYSYTIWIWYGRSEKSLYENCNDPKSIRATISLSIKIRILPCSWGLIVHVRKNFHVPDCFNLSVAIVNTSPSTSTSGGKSITRQLWCCNINKHSRTYDYYVKERYDNYYWRKINLVYIHSQGKTTLSKSNQFFILYNWIS